jgi:hypothetical protein
MLSDRPRLAGTSIFMNPVSGILVLGSTADNSSVTASSPDRLKAPRPSTVLLCSLRAMSTLQSIVELISDGHEVDSIP